MFKRIISLVLVITMFLSIAIAPDYAFAMGENENIQQLPTPIITSIDSYNWDGKFIKAGDTEFYVSAYGKNFDNLSVVVGTIEGEGENEVFTPVAVQLEHKYVGLNSSGDEWHMYKMKTDDQGLQIDTTYYVFLQDENGNRYKDTSSYNYFDVGESSDFYIDYRDMELLELPTSISSYNISVYGMGFDFGVQPEDVELGLYTDIDSENDNANAKKVGIVSDVAIYESYNDSILFKGDASFTETIADKEKIYVGITYNDETVYTYSPVMYMIDGTKTTLGQMNVVNGVAKFYEDGGHHHGGGVFSNYVTADGRAFYINNEENKIDFMFSATKINDISKLGVRGATLDNANIVKSKNGVQFIEGTITTTNTSTTSTITFTYDGTDIYELPIERSNSVGVLGMETDLNFESYNNQWPENNQVKATIITFGDYDGVYTANLYKDYISDENIVGELEVSKTLKANKDIELTIKLPTQGIEDNTQYMIIIQRNGVATQSVSYEFNGETSNLETYDNDLCVNLRTPEAVTGQYPVLNYIDNKNGELVLCGSGYEEGKTYTANFIKRGLGSSLIFTPQTLTANYASSNKLTISKENTATLPLGWYTVYVTDGENQVHGFVDTAIIPTDDESPSIIAPTAVINDNAPSTKVREVKLNLTEGSYTHVRFAESEQELSSADYQPITSSVDYTLSDGYGTKTVYFEFKNVDGLTYKLSDSIVYNAATLDDMLSYGISSVNLESEEPIVLDKTGSYNFYITANSNALVGNVVFLDNQDAEISREALRCTVTKEGISTYSKWIDLLEYDGTSKIVFYLSDIADSSRMSKEEEINASIINIVKINNIKTTFKYKYIGDKQYVVRGSKVDFYMTGSKDYTAMATINYKDGDTTKCTEYTLNTDGNGTYRLTTDLPRDITKIINVVYSLNNNISSTKYKTEEFEYPITAALNFININNADGRFNGKFIKISSANGRQYYQTIKNNQTSVVFDSLEASEYDYSIYDYKITYISGSAYANSGATNSISVESAKQPLKIKFTTNDETIDSKAKVYYTYMLDDRSYSGYGKIGEGIDGFYTGQEITYRLILGHDDLKNYIMPEDQTIIIGGETTDIEIPVQPFEKVTVSGNVSDEMVDGRNLNGVSLLFTQYVQNRYTYFSYTTTAVTDENGNYQVELYPGQVNVTCSMNGYRNNYSYFDVETTMTKDFELEYNDKNIIRLMLYGSENVKEGEEAGEPISLDSSLLRDISVEKSDGSYIGGYLQYGSMNYRLYDENLKSGDKLTITATFDNKVSTQNSYEVVLDEHNCASVKIIATNYGTFSVNVVDTDESATYYMLVYNKANGRLIGTDVGDTRLTSAKCSMYKVKDCVVIFVKGDNLMDMLPSITTLDLFNNLNLVEDKQYKKYEVVLENGIDKELADINVSEEISSNLLHFNINYQNQFDINKRRIVYNASIYPILNSLGSNTDIKKIELVTPEGDTIKDLYFANKYVYECSTIDVSDNVSNINYGRILAYIDIGTDSVTQIGLKITYEYQEKEYVTTYNTNIDTPYVTINPPDEVMRGLNAQKVTINGDCKSGQKIEIYDDETLIGTATSNAAGKFSTVVSLSYPDISCLHNLRAKVVVGDEEIYSSTVLCNVIDPKVDSYVSNFKFRNINPVYDPESTQQFEVEGPDSNNKNVYSAYYPNAKSEVSFRINNLLKDDLSEVEVINTYNGIDSTFAAEWVKDVQEGDTCYSEWYYQGNFGYLGELSVFYSLNNLEKLDTMTGEHLLDFEKAATTYVEPAQLPQAVKDNLDTLEFENLTNTHVSGSMDLPSGKSEFDVSYTENINITPTELLEQGFKEFKTKQGTYYAKETYIDSESNGIVNISLNRTMYFDSALTEILNSNESIDELSINSISKKDNNCVVIQGAGEVVDTGLSCVNFVGSVQTTTEIIYEASKGEALELGKYGTGMQVVGGVALAVDIVRGATATKGTQPLYDAAQLIEDDSKRQQIYDEIVSYGKLARGTYGRRVLFSAINYGTGYGGPTAKAIGLVAGIGGGYFVSLAEAEHNKEWDSIMTSILSIIKVQEYKKEKDIEKDKKKDKKKAGKKVKIIKPKWSIDPSGYVFEAIDSQRVKDITARAYFEEYPIGYLYWEDADLYGEVNPDITDIDGRYGWNVPEGKWKVTFEGEGYQNSETKPMNVPPAHDKVNIGLISTKVPCVDSVAINDIGLEVEFDMYMQAESIYDKDNNISSIRVYDSEGRELPLKTIDYLISSENTSYKVGATYQNDIIDSDTFVKRVRFVVDDSAYVGGFKEFKDDGVTKESYKVVVNTNAQSYSGVNMLSEFNNSDVKLAKREQLAAPTTDKATGNYEDSIKVILSTSQDAKIYYTTDGSIPTTSSKVYTTPIDVIEDTTIKCLASKIGYDDSSIVTFEYTIGKIKSDVGDDNDNDNPGSYNPGNSGDIKENDEDKVDDKIVKEYKEQFTDVSSQDWYYNSVKFVYERGLFSGLTETEFAPYDSMTRAMLVTVLHRFAGLPEGKDSEFTDVKDNTWYTDAINWAAENDIVSGKGANLFAPNENITREQIALVIYNYVNKNAETLCLDMAAKGDLTKFEDANNISTWSKDAMTWAVGIGLFSGNDKNELNAKGFANRAEVATMLMRFIQKVEANMNK